MLVCIVYFTTRLALATEGLSVGVGVTILAATLPLRHMEWMRLQQRRCRIHLNCLEPSVWRFWHV